MRFFSLLTAATVATVSTCSNDPTAPINTDLTLRVGETISVAGADLSLKFVRVVQDSRCPIDVQCVWAGNGQIELDARADGQTTIFVLNTIDGAKEFVVSPYRISLLELTPVPTSGGSIPPASYRAKLYVTRPGSVCTEEARPALMVALTDSISGANNFTGVSVVARDGAYADSVAQPTYPGLPYNGPVALAYERAGNYTITVRADGYVPWVRTAVAVTRDQCHVVTVGITARLKH